MTAITRQGGVIRNQQANQATGSAPKPAIRQSEAPKQSETSGAQMEHQEDYSRATGQIPDQAAQPRVAREEVLQNRLAVLSANRLTGGKLQELTLDGDLTPGEEKLLKSLVPADQANFVVNAAEMYAARVREEFKYIADAGVLDGGRDRPTPENVENVMRNWVSLRAAASVAQNTSLLNLDEAGLGKELAEYTTLRPDGGQALAKELFQTASAHLGQNDAAQVARAYTQNLSTEELGSLDLSTLNTLHDAMNRVYLTTPGMQAYNGPQNSAQREQMARVEHAMRHK
ncbi:MAG: hypothetical protein ABIJ09_13160 [Pseudomonadota bacterium]